MRKIKTRKTTYSIVLHRLPVLLELNTYTFTHILYNLLYYLTIYKFNFSEDDSRISIATNILQFVFLSNGGFPFPIARFPTMQCPAAMLRSVKFWEGVLKMGKAEFT